LKPRIQSGNFFPKAAKGFAEVKLLCLAMYYRIAIFPDAFAKEPKLIYELIHPSVCYTNVLLLGQMLFGSVIGKKGLLPE
jgi:hypothetical protein